MRVSKQVMEETVYQAQLVVSIQQALVEDMGIPLELANGLKASFLVGDLSLKLELENAISEKQKGFNVATLTSVTEILRKHSGKTEAQLAVGLSSRNIAATKLKMGRYGAISGADGPVLRGSGEFPRQFGLHLGASALQLGLSQEIFCFDSLGFREGSRLVFKTQV